MTQRIDIDRLLREAIQCHARNDLTRAERIYNEMLALMPNHLAASYNLALLLAESGRHHIARKKLEALIKARPHDAASHHTLGKLLRGGGTTVRACIISGEPWSSILAASPPISISLRVTDF